MICSTVEEAFKDNPQKEKIFGSAYCSPSKFGLCRFSSRSFRSMLPVVACSSGSSIIARVRLPEERKIHF